MVPPRNKKRPSDGEAQVVAAQTLKEALRAVRERYGPDAPLIHSRTVQRPAGLGQKRYVEVTVGPTATLRPAGFDADSDNGGGALLDPAASAVEIARELKRLEELVEDLARARTTWQSEFSLPDHPVAAALVAAGTSPPIAADLLRESLQHSDSASESADTFLPFLRRQLRTAGEEWNDLRGCHVFLGDEGCGKSELVLAMAAKLQSLGKATLVLNLLPRHAGEIRRLQQEASRHGYDAAILQRTDQLVTSWTHIARYEVALIDTPPLRHPDLVGSGEVQRLIGQNAGLHRHLVVSLDADLTDGDFHRRATRDWNFDWLALTRIDRTRRAGKIVDLMHENALPVSFLTRGSWPARRVDIASSDLLLGLILGAGANDINPAEPENKDERRDAAQA